MHASVLNFYMGSLISCFQIIWDIDWVIYRVCRRTFHLMTLNLRNDMMTSFSISCVLTHIDRCCQRMSVFTKILVVLVSRLSKNSFAGMVVTQCSIGLNRLGQTPLSYSREQVKVFKKRKLFVISMQEICKGMQKKHQRIFFP